MGDLRCPCCQQTFDPQQTVAMPFCSLRCKMIDLGRWLKEEIGVPVEPDEHDDGSEPETHEDKQHD